MHRLKQPLFAFILYLYESPSGISVFVLYSPPRTYRLPVCVRLNYCLLHVINCPWLPLLTTVWLLVCINVSGLRFPLYIIIKPIHKLLLCYVYTHANAHWLSIRNASPIEFTILNLRFCITSLSKRVCPFLIYLTVRLLSCILESNLEYPWLTWS